MKRLLCQLKKPADQGRLLYDRTLSNERQFCHKERRRQENHIDVGFNDDTRLLVVRIFIVLICPGIIGHC